MSINCDKPHLWKRDIEASVDLFNRWFMRFAPKAYRDARVQATTGVKHALQITKGLLTITPKVLRQHPEILPALRAATCPPLARDRLIGLSGISKNLVKCMEQGRIPPRMSAQDIEDDLRSTARIISRMLDSDIFPWLEHRRPPRGEQQYRASTVVADRLCGAVSDPIIRNAQERRQLVNIEKHLKKRGYKRRQPPPGRTVEEMLPGTFGVRAIAHGKAGTRMVSIPVDVAIQPKSRARGALPILIEAKSAGDFTNVNKRRKEEATKLRQLRANYGPDVQLTLFLCGYFDSGYLGYEAAEGIDWVWEHRITDMDALGI